MILCGWICTAQVGVYTARVAMAVACKLCDILISTHPLKLLHGLVRPAVFARRLDVEGADGM
jgi:hypothetical protein